MDKTLWLSKWRGVKVSFADNFSFLSFGKAEVASERPGIGTDSALGKMALYFHSQASVVAYLLFILLYFPCISTLAVIVREVSRAWAVVSVVWATGIAYGVSVVVYQMLTIRDHVWLSLMWCIILALSIFGGYRVLRRMWRSGALCLGEGG